jgi:glycosyltransferase involved in cell wall biosynthesis
MGAHRDPAVTLVIPCFNEEQRLDAGALLRHLEARTWLRLILVDDGSTDGTAALLAELAALAPDRISVVSLGQNQGKGEAVRQGMLLALDRRADLAGFWDADLAIPLDELDGMVDLLTTEPGLLAAFGSRRELLAEARARRRMRRRIGRLASALVHWTLPLEIVDTQCGAKLFRCTEAVARAFSEPFLSRWLFDVELILRLRIETGAPESLLIAEHALARCSDVRSSKLRLSDYVRGLVELLQIRSRYRAGRGRSTPR